MVNNCIFYNTPLMVFKNLEIGSFTAGKAKRNAAPSVCRLDSFMYNMNVCLAPKVKTTGLMSIQMRDL